MSTVEPTSGPPVPVPPRHRNRVRTFIVLVALAVIALVELIVLVRSGIVSWPKQVGWTYGGQLHRVIAASDRIVVRDGGFDCCGLADNDDILFEVTDPQEIAEVFEKLQFRAKQRKTQCKCCGFPGIDWYRGKERLALTAIQHGTSLRWGGVPGDAELTREAGDWIVTWLGIHGVSAKEIELGCGGPRSAGKRQAANAARRQSTPSPDGQAGAPARRSPPQ